MLILDHDITLAEYLKVTSANGLKIGLDKIQYKVKKAHFLETTITTDGHPPTDEKITATQEMEQQSDVKLLQSLLGMVNYFHKYTL